MTTQVRRGRKKEAARLEPMQPPESNIWKLNGPPVLIWTESQDRAYREGRGPPPFE